MRHGGQRSRRFMRREEMRRAHRLLAALGRQAERQRRKELEEVEHDKTRMEPAEADLCSVQR